MDTQKFKGDETELKFEEAGRIPFDMCSQSLDQYFAGAFESPDFLLAQYDAGRMPFSDRVPRASFVSFIKQAIPNFKKTGTFDSYIFILQSIFGSTSGIQFEIPGPGKLDILVNASASLEFDFEGREFVNGAYETFTVETMALEQLQFKGISGIDNEAKLKQLMAELIPGGVFTQITLSFFILSDFIDNLGNSVVDHLGNQIVFFETGE